MGTAWAASSRGTGPARYRPNYVTTHLTNYPVTRRLRRPPPILLALLLAPLSMALGFVGYRNAPDLALSRSDALYAALQLFTVGGVIPTSTPWQLDLARFLAPVAVVYAAVVAVIALLRDRAQRLLVQAMARRHVVVVGLGATGSLVAQGLRMAGERVVVLEIDRRSTRIAAARSAGVRVVVGDGTSAAHLARTKIHRARHVIVLSADDSRNLEIAAVAREVLERHRATGTTMHVAIGGSELWKELDRLRLSMHSPGVNTEYVNLDDRTALRLLTSAEAGNGGRRLDWVLVDGDTTVATRVVAHVVRRALLAGVRPRVDLSGGADTAADLLNRLRADEPWCEEFADIRTLPSTGPERGAGAPLAVVCLVEADAAAITRGLVLARRMPGTHVVIGVYRPRSEQTLEAAGPLGQQVHLVPAKFEALGTELLNRSSTELMARVRHEDYVAREAAKGATPGTNPSMVAWEALPESLQQSNRAFAEAVGQAIGKLHGELVPLGGPVADNALPVPPHVLNELARGEHDRWVSSLQRDGWRHTTGPKDPQARLHPLLVPWEELSEGEREKDRDAFRVLPHMLARIGYALVIPAHDR